jgi:hypothetical protein
MADRPSRTQAGLVLRGSFDRRYQRHPDRSTGEIRDVIPDDDGQIVGVTVDIGGEVTTLDPPGGRGMAFLVPGMLWSVKKAAGDNLGARWEFDYCLTNIVGSSTDSPVIYLPVPVIQASTLGGFRTYQGKASADPGGPINAALSVYPRSTTFETGTLYDWRVASLALQLQVAGDDEWLPTIISPLMPSSRIQFSLSADIDETDTTLSIALPAGDTYSQVPSNVPIHFRVGGEIVLGVWNGSTTITVVSHNGIGNSEQGLGFVTSAMGRGMDATDAEAHTTGTKVECFSAQIGSVDLRPGQTYRFRVASVTASGRFGPWSENTSFTSWEETYPPIAVENLLVEHLAGSIRANWDRVILDTSGKDRADVKIYAVFRHTAALAVGLTIAQVISAGATPIDLELGATSVVIPATKGFGNYVGVAAIDSSGLLSEWHWEQDNLAPPYPDPSAVVMWEVEEGIAYSVPESSNSYNAQTNALILSPAHADRGFVEYVLLVAGDNVGGSAAVAGRSSSSGTTIPIVGGVTGWYKLVAADRAGNYVTAASPNNAGYATGWKFIFSRYAEIGIPPNGNFQIPNETNTDAKGWTSTIFPGIIDYSSYRSTGGKEGNRVYGWAVPVSDLNDPTTIQISGDRSRLLPATDGTGAVASGWVYQNSGVSKNFKLQFSFLASSDDNGALNDAGTWTIQTPVALSIPSGTWTRITATTVTVSLTANARSGFWIVSLIGNPAHLQPGPYEILFDAVKLAV